MGPHIVRGKLPTAREAKDAKQYVEIGKYAVSHNPWDQQQNMRFLWRVHGPKQEDGTREILEDFATYREAVKDARARESKDVENARTAYWRLSNAAPELLKAIDDALGTLVDCYQGELDLGNYNEVLWTLIRAADKARGRRTAKTLPEQWGDAEKGL